MLKLYNTLSRKIEEVPKKNHLNLYTCGPTVYNYAHIGNLRSFIMADLLYRTLKFEGYNPKWVMNITDIDDKTIKGTLAEFGKTSGVKELYDFTEKYLRAFVADLKEVNVLVNEIELIRVTDKMSEIQEFIVGLLDKGYAYKADDGVYFSIEKYQKDFGDYGQLVGEKFLEGKKVGARVAVDEYEKDNLSDFVLWKNHNPETDGNIFWDHPLLGKGRPGWHIECSVINHVAFKGEATDIHTGGVDLMFPHHANEIAQSQAFLGRGNFVKYWFHSEHLLVDGKKMSKSSGNFYTLKDLVRKGFSAQDFRYAMFASSYRAQQNFTWENLLSVHTALEKFLAFPSGAVPDEVINIFNEDLNIPEALGLLWGHKISNSDLLGIKPNEAAAVPGNVTAILALRQAAKDQKDFDKSDDFRKQIEELGYEVMDTPEGQKVRKKLSI